MHAITTPNNPPEAWPDYSQYFDMTVDKIFERMNVIAAELHRVNLAVSRGGHGNVATPQESWQCTARPEMPVVQGQVVGGEVQPPQIQQLHQPQQQFLGPDGMINIQILRWDILYVFWSQPCFAVSSFFSFHCFCFFHRLNCPTFNRATKNSWFCGKILVAWSL